MKGCSIEITLKDAGPGWYPTFSLALDIVIEAFVLQCYTDDWVGGEVQYVYPDENGCQRPSVLRYEVWTKELRKHGMRTVLAAEVAASTSCFVSCLCHACRLLGKSLPWKVRHLLRRSKYGRRNKTYLLRRSLNRAVRPLLQLPPATAEPTPFLSLRPLQVHYTHLKSFPVSG